MLRRRPRHYRDLFEAAARHAENWLEGRGYEHSRLTISGRRYMQPRTAAEAVEAIDALLAECVAPAHERVQAVAQPAQAALDLGETAADLGGFPELPGPGQPAY